MRKDLDKKLCKIAPHLFADRYGDMRNTCMYWGFDCGDGWYDILVDAALKLEALIVQWIAVNPYKNEFPFWIFSRSNMYITLRWRCYSFLAIWEWMLVGLGLRKPLVWWPCASQVKEKFGTLRFYLTQGTEEMYAITDEAERKSAKTCEECGKPGKLRGHGWVYTRCAACWKNKQKANYNAL
jgi:hypothetical protein